jgi:hypothetical protein
MTRFIRERIARVKGKGKIKFVKLGKFISSRIAQKNHKQLKKDQIGGIMEPAGPLAAMSIAAGVG